MKRSEKVITELENTGFRVEWNNGNWKVYEYSQVHEAYLFCCYCQTVKELERLRDTNND